MVSAQKLTKREAGRLGADARWGPERRHVDLRRVNPAVAGVIRAILDAAEHAAKTEASPGKE